MSWTKEIRHLDEELKIVEEEIKNYDWNEMKQTLRNLPGAMMDGIKPVENKYLAIYFIFTNKDGQNINAAMRTSLTKYQNINLFLNALIHQVVTCPKVVQKTSVIIDIYSAIEPLSDPLTYPFEEIVEFEINFKNHPPSIEIQDNEN